MSSRVGAMIPPPDDGPLESLGFAHRSEPDPGQRDTRPRPVSAGDPLRIALARGNGPEALPPEIADHRREEFVHLNVAAPMLDAYLLVVDPQTAPVLHHARLTSIRWCAPQVRTCVTSGWSTRRTRA